MAQEAAFNEVANSPLEIELNGKKYKARRISLQTIFGKAETAVIALQMKRIREMADELADDDKAAFLAKAMIESIPSGYKLSVMAENYLRSAEGVRMVVEDALRTDHSEEELAALNIIELVEKEKTKIQLLVDFAINRKGSDKKSKAPFPAQEPGLKTT